MSKPRRLLSSKAPKSRIWRSRGNRPKKKADAFQHPLLQLQQTLGNRAVSRMIQAKLAICNPGDHYEREADRVADRVMRMPEAPIQPKPICPLAKGPSCGEEEVVRRQTVVEEIRRAAKGNAHSAHTNPSTESAIRSLAGGGHPLSRSERVFFETRLGADLSQVRLHTDATAAESARALQARAYTVGDDVVFNANQFAPGSFEGRKLLAHELGHVIQQRFMVQKKIQKQSIHNPLFPCHETSVMPGGMDFFGTLVHLAIQQHYVRNIDPMAATEYVIPGSGGGGATGRADIVDSGGGIYEIKPLGLADQGFFEAENYLLNAEISCDPKVNWHLGDFYFPPPVPMIINGVLIHSWLHGPGVIVYVRRTPKPVPVPVPVPSPEKEKKPKPSTYRLILEWARQVINSGADAVQAADEFLRQNPGIAWTILILGVVGIIALAADDVTLAGIADDVLIPVITALIRVAWRYA
jgi:hypothetical protein